MCNNYEEPLTEEIIDSVLADFFPNANTEEELEYELECWAND